MKEKRMNLKDLEANEEASQDYVRIMEEAEEEEILTGLNQHACPVSPLPFRGKPDSYKEPPTAGTEKPCSRAELGM